MAAQDRYEDRASPRPLKAAADSVGSLDPTAALPPVVADGPVELAPAPVKLGARIGVPLVAALLAAGTALLLVSGPIAGLGPVHHITAQPLVAVLLTITFAAVMLGPVSVHYRGQTYLFVLSEVPLLLGLVIAAPVVLVISRVIGEAFALGGVRRQSPLKLAFNLASAAMSCVVSILVYRAILGPLIHSPRSTVAVLPDRLGGGRRRSQRCFLVRSPRCQPSSSA